VAFLPSEAPIFAQYSSALPGWDGLDQGDAWCGTPDGAGWASLRLPVTHETPGDSRVRGLPSPVCTARATNQGWPPKTVGDCGRRPAQQRHARWFGTTILQPLSLASPTLTCANCCPDAAFGNGLCNHL
jgi:hypothetical protein